MRWRTGIEKSEREVRLARATPGEEPGVAIGAACWHLRRNHKPQSRSGIAYTPRVADSAGPFFDDSPTTGASPALRGNTPADASALEPRGSFERAGSVIGPYKLLEVIGEGGFGVVYLAEQTLPVRRRVAFKIIRPGMDSRAVLARFDAERQALALMSHPNVAKVFDAGSTPAEGPGAGRPYFVMEHVKGLPITDYCDQNRLTIDQRLRLFMSVCDAVQHAHMKGIIHRDLKPSNILVSIADTGEPRPVVIDFGIAKALSGRLTDHTIFTMRGELIGTPEYMSPEQAEMAETDIDTRSDVYALGVVLYELLTGALPFDPQVLRSAGIAALQRVIREQDPPRPSFRLTTMGPASAGVAAARRTDLPSLTSLLKRELEWILLKALRKDRRERYRSAAEFADDLGNFLTDRPVIAAPESPAYRARKFIRRNRALVAGAGAVVVALALGVAGIAWQAKLARDERDNAVASQTREAEQRAEAEKQRSLAQANAAAEARARVRAQAINRFVTEALRSADPEQGGRQSTTILEAMASARRDLESGRFRDDPETEAALQETVATILENNARAAEAEPLYARALATRRAIHAGDHDDVAESLSSMGIVLESLGRESEALPYHEQALGMLRRLHPDDHERVASAMANLGNVRKSLGDAAGALPLLTHSLEMKRRVFAGDHPAIAQGLHNLGACLVALGREGEGEQVIVQSLAMRQRLWKGDHPAVAQAIEAVAFVRMQLGKAEESIPMFERALEMRRRLFAGDHPAVAMGINNLATATQAAGRYEDALLLYTESLDMQRRLNPGDHPDVALALSNVAGVRCSLGRYADAEELYRESAAMYRRLYTGDHPSIAQSFNNMGYVRSMQDDTSQGAEYYQLALDMRRRIHKGDHPQIAESLNNLAFARASLGDLKANEALVREAMEMYQRLYPGDHPDVAMAMMNLSVAVSKNNDAPGAEKLTEQAAAMYQRLHKGDHPDVAWSLANLAVMKSKSGDAGGAVKLGEQALAMAERLLPSDHPDLEQYRKTVEICKNAMKNNE